MGQPTKPPRRITAVLNHPEYQVPLLLVQARGIVQSMSGNAWFSDPSPRLEAIEAAIEELAAAETATLGRTMGTVAVRDEKRGALVMLLQQLMAYVQTVADANVENAVSIIESGGYSVKRPGIPPARVFAAKTGPVAGSVTLVVPKSPGATAYEWAYRTDGAETWVASPNTSQTTTTVSGIEPGTRVQFRYRPVTRKNDGNWSEPVSIIVV
jgi:hypothetical protein